MRNQSGDVTLWMKSGKASGADGLPQNLFKSCDPKFIATLVKLLGDIWMESEHFHRLQGCTDCLHRQADRRLIVSLRQSRTDLVAIDTRQDRSSRHIKPAVYDTDILPESQCGFQACRGAKDMIFTTRQLPEKCREEQRELFAVFVDGTRGVRFCRQVCCLQILLKIGCPTDFVNTIRTFRDGMRVCLIKMVKSIRTLMQQVMPNKAAFWLQCYL